ncbi:hypothetical protein S245_013352, partial [Arachis hypogaea]
HGLGVKCLFLFLEMCDRVFNPNFMTYGSVLSACASIGDLEWDAHLHARVLHVEHVLDAYLGSGLIDMYPKCGRLELARRVFDCLEERNEFGLEEDALALFNQMRQASVVLDDVTLATVLRVYLEQNHAAIGELLHGYTIKSGMDFYVPVGNAIITMYSKFGDFEKAYLAFRLMPLRDTISWTSMITAFSQNGDISRARHAIKFALISDVSIANSFVT